LSQYFLDRYIELAILILILVTYTYLTVTQAINLENEEIRRFQMGAKGYVSDEVWYVDAARNILRRVFGLEPKRAGFTYNATLVYSTREEVVKALTYAQVYGVTIVNTLFSNLSAIYVSAKSRESIEAFGKATNAIDIVFGWMLGDAVGINNYLNLEHPPMSKYLIALTMLVLGDRPFYWRVPSIVMGMLVVILTFITAKRIIGNMEISLIVMAIAAVDPLIRNLASVALLDIYTTAFTLLAIFLAVSKKYKESLLMLGFASTFKFTALLAFTPILLLYIGELVRRGINRAREVLIEIVELFLLTVTSFLFFQMLTSIPIILRIGFSSWFQQSIFGAISWHLSVKCVGGKCPIASAPWDWFFGINSFPLYVYSDGITLYAQGLVPTYMLSFILMIFTFAYRFQDARSISKKPWMIFCGLFISYMLLWVAGAKTQYSFYAVQLAPFIHIYLITQIYEFLNRNSIINVLIAWKKAFELLWKGLLLLLG